ncbi:MAG: serine protein kinase PrkA [Polyangiales bacterium]
MSDAASAASPSTRPAPDRGPLGPLLDGIASEVQEQFEVGRRVLSFDEYLALFAGDPLRHGRDASRYLRDCFDFFGTVPVEKSWGTETRYRLFDLPFAEEATRRERLIGQEDVQEEIYRVLSNFVREGRPNKLMLLHGPNGSAKSTIAGCLLRALEHYSTLDDGAIYRFHWLFPSAKTIKSRIGFHKPGDPAGELTQLKVDESYAHLEEDLIDAKLFSEIRDHPLFLLSPERRKPILEKALSEKGITEPPCDWLLRGRLSHRSQQVFEALLTSYRGDLKQVLRHVSVERYFISRRYRVGAVTIGPQMSVDAGERQITMDRSLSALPSSLQAVTMFEAFGELVDASGGLLEYSDLLKRPIDAYKYLQLSIETGEIALQHQTVQLNAVLFGSANEVHLNALKEHPEWASFRGRMELIRTPYLRSYVEEQQIYDAQVVPSIRRHVAPHATFVAALFAVLTRMRKPVTERTGPDKELRYQKPIAAVVGSLSAIEKAELYARGTLPDRLDADAAKVLRGAIGAVHDESRTYPIYEGRIGASPREIRTVLLDAAQDERFRCLSPLAVLDAIAVLCERVGEYEWLHQESLAGGYHDTKSFLEHCKAKLIDRWEDDLRAASGLFEPRSHLDLFELYVRNVSLWIKGEKVRNPMTGVYEEAEATLMDRVEKQLGISGTATDFRRGIMSSFAAWSIDHPGEKIEQEVVFPQHVRKLRDAGYIERKKSLTELCKLLITLVDDDGRGLEAAQRKQAQDALGRLEAMGACRFCTRDSAAGLLRWRLT